MGLDLGTLSARIEIKDSGVESKINRVRAGLEKVDEAASKVDGKKIDLSPKGTGALDKASTSAKGLGTNLNDAGTAGQKLGTELDKASSSSRDLSTGLGRAGSMGKSLTVSTQPATELSKGAEAASKLGDKLGETASKYAKLGAAAAGGAVLGGLGASLTAGFKRLNAIDQATAKLEALGNSGSDVQTIMDNALASVKGTAFGIGDAAGTAATMVAAGVKPGQELESVLKGVADSAAVAGTDLNEMGLIWGKAAAKQKIDGQIINSLLERQIPIYDILGEKMGKSAEEIADMVSKGKVSFKEFSEAMQEYVGGGALRMGDTMQGAWENAKAAAGRFGAALLEPAFKAAPGVFSSITDSIDDMTAKVGPAAEEFARKFGPQLESFASSIGPRVAATAQTVGDAFGLIAPPITAVAKAMASVPFPVYIGAATALIAKHKGWTSALSDTSSGMRGFMTQVAASQAQIAAQGRQISTVNATMLTLGQRVPTIGRMASAFQSASTPLRIMGMESRAAGAEIGGLAGMARRAGGGVQTMGGVMAGVAGGGMSLLKSGAQGIMSMFGGPWGLAIAGASTALAILAKRHQEAAQKEQEHKQYVDQIRDSFDEATGSITENTRQLQLNRAEKDGLIQSANKLGIEQGVIVDAMNGSANAITKVNAAVDAQGAKAVQATDFWATWGNELTKYGISASDVAGYMNGAAGATEKFMDATSKMSGDGLTGIRGDAIKARDGIKEATAEGAKLKNEVGQSAAAFKEASEAADRMARESTLSGDKLREAFKLIGDEITAMPDEKTIEVKSLAPKVREELRQLGAEVEELPDGKVRVSFPDGMNISQALSEMGVRIKQLPDGTVSIKDNSPEVQQRMIALGIAVRDPKTGEVKIRDNVAESIQRQIQLGIAVRDPKTGHVFVSDNVGQVMQALDRLGVKTTLLPGGHIQVTDTSAENMKHLESLGLKTKTLPNGKVVITENANAVRNKIKTTLSEENTRTQSSHTISIVRRIKDIFERANGGIDTYADGGFSPTPRVERYADGGQRAVERAQRGQHTEPPHQAHIAPAGAWRLFAEPETGGEAYIPLAQSKRPRSERILNEVAGQFGYQLVDQAGQVARFADGGFSGAIKRKLRFMDGTPYVFGGWSPAGVDCSGAVALMDNARQGGDLWKPGRFATGNQASELTRRGWRRGRGGAGDFRTGFKNGGPGGGHTAGQLPDGTFIESGGNTGGGFTIGGKAGPLTGQGFTDWFYYPGSPAIGREGLSDYSELDLVAGARPGMDSTTGESSTTTKTIHGGAGTLLKDGSFLELVAALHSKATGKKYQDDIVSWGQVMGLYTKVEGEDGEKKLGKTQKDLEKAQKDLEKAEKDLPNQKEALRIAKLKRDELNKKKNVSASQRAQADLSVRKAEQRVQETERKIRELRKQIAELERALAKGIEEDVDALGGLTDGLPDPKTAGNKNADSVIREGRRRKISDRGIQIALATGLVESNLRNLANPKDPESLRFPNDGLGYDHDSTGIFQQRANGAWGTVRDRMTPHLAAGMFYKQLAKGNYNEGDPGAHAQRVQVSAFPARYNQKMKQAGDILKRYGGVPAKVTPMADGGILGHARNAQINDGTSAVLWAEAGPEAYIPLSRDKRARAIDVWAETGKRLGLDVMGMINLMASGLPGLAEGRLNFSTGQGVDVEAMGLNMDAASYRAGQRIGNSPQARQAVGAVFNGPVVVNDPRKYLQGQLNNAGKQLGSVVRSVRL